MDQEESKEFKFTLRIPAKLWVKLNLRADSNRRSLNSEILVILERTAVTGEVLTEASIIAWLREHRPDLLPSESGDS